ncbi:hypothetical protein CGRA01v4_07619 [Colletotrichum graminicola]|nr:hypothetical protein CGRA01v4_07619 [Colletotrichum graminicola]
MATTSNEPFQMMLKKFITVGRQLSAFVVHATHKSAVCELMASYKALIADLLVLLGAGMAPLADGLSV